MLIFTVALLLGLAYFGLIRPRMRLRRDIKKTRKWVFKQMGLSGAGLSESGPDSSKSQSLGMGAIPEIREYWGYPPRQELVLEEVRTRDDIGGNWDFDVHIHEGAEQYLGSERFSSLKRRFSEIPGVDECVHQDREVFLVRTKSLDPEQLRKAFWEVFLKAAEGAFENNV